MYNTIKELKNMETEILAAMQRIAFEKLIDDGIILQQAMQKRIMEIFVIRQAIERLENL